MDGGAKSRSRAGVSEQDVRERRPNPSLSERSEEEKDLKRRLRRPSGGKAAMDGGAGY
jgi:hypothetical protein